MAILITGAAGFIGYSFCKKLAEKKIKTNIICIDNINNYYSIKIKNARLRKIEKFKNFKFYRLDLSNASQLGNLFKKYKFKEVYNFAAQAGVRYSEKNQKAYIKSNIEGFMNLISISKKKRVKKFFYASSSSVYGENKNFPLNEKENIFPKNIYGLSKKINEEIGFIFNKYYNTKLIGLRFFTVYGEWGRPDMMMMKYIDCFYKKKIFYLNNYGNHSRDFTYIGDVVNILYLLLKKHKKLKGYDLFNICSNKPINLKKIISFMKKNKICPKVKKVSLQKADILKTHGDNKKLLKSIKYKKFSDWKSSVQKTIVWYQKNILKN